MTQIYRMADAAFPAGGKLPAGSGAVAGYIGGEHALHTWSAKDWKAFAGIRKLPIWVPSNTSGGEADGWACLEAMYKLGIPQGSAVAYDKETDVNPAQCKAFCAVVQWAGFHPWVYGSASTVFGNAVDNYWVADYVQHPYMYPGRNVRATQYEDNIKSSGTAFDLSEVKKWSYFNRLKKNWAL